MYRLGFLLLFLSGSCQPKQNQKDLYELLYVCFEAFYEEQSVGLQLELTTFELQLIEEGHLHSIPTGSDFKKLLEFLSRNIYFPPPLRKDDFNQALLMKNPDNLVECLNFNYNIDSLDLMELSYYKATKEIGRTIEESEEVSIQAIFSTYATHIQVDEFNQPFVRESMLLLLYRWYYKSKYDRDIPINLEE